MERTLFIVKPAAVARGLVGEVIGRLERKGLALAALKVVTITRETAMRHYAEHVGKPFFEGLVASMTSAPVVVGIVAGENAVAVVRKLAGTTNPADAAPGTIRGDLGLVMTDNVVHASDSPASAEREIGIFFPGI